MKLMHKMMKLALISCLSFLLFACEGAETTENPFTEEGGTINEGPPAADEDTRDFEVNVWNNLIAENRCGACHKNSGTTKQSPFFADSSDVNFAYAEVLDYINRDDPSSSQLVTKVGSGHNCWEAIDSVCADSVENMIANWVGESTSTSSRQIQLTAPVIKEPGETKSFPVTATESTPNSYAETIHEIVKVRCIACHYEEGLSQQQAPFFANPDSSASYTAVQPKLNIDNPINSRLVQRLLGNHNCWSNCADNAADMEDAITQFADAIIPTSIDPNLVTSKVLTMLDGIIASGGNRHEADLLALWEFKAGEGSSTAFDTSGIEPAVNLNLNGSVTWLGAYGLEFSGGKAQATTQASKKLHDLLKIAGEYSLEAWVIPANVTQEDANIISYDAGANLKNFALSQTLYNYNFHNRTDASDSNGEAALSTPDADEVLQATLQHVVITYGPVAGRKIYVNANLIDEADPVTDSTSISNWADNYALVMGQSVANNHTWLGKIRMAAVHSRVLSPEQVLQNFDVGVGQKYFLLFSVSDELSEPSCLVDAADPADPQVHQCYIQFEVSQFDSFSYLFDQPKFIHLDNTWVPGEFTIKNMRIGINGNEATSGQAFANIDVSINSTDYIEGEGQSLSDLGTIIALEKGIGNDELFLTFEELDAESNAFVDPAPTPPSDPADAQAVSDIGIRTFEDINASIAQMTGIATTNASVASVYTQYKQQLPSVENIDTFLPSHQMAIAQLALISCSERVDADNVFVTGSLERVLFTDVDFSESAETAFDDVTKRSNVVDPILEAVLLNDLDTQPDATEVSSLLGDFAEQSIDSGDGIYNYDSLITKMTVCPIPTNPDFPCDLNSDIYTPARTVQIVKAVCAAVVGSAALLIQ